ncbi:hypothetical protein ACFL5N_02865, partial [bacterium]
TFVEIEVTSDSNIEGSLFESGVKEAINNYERDNIDIEGVKGPSIIVRNTKGTIVDVWEVRGGEYVSRNDGINKVITEKKVKSTKKKLDEKVTDIVSQVKAISDTDTAVIDIEDIKGVKNIKQVVKGVQEQMLKDGVTKKVVFKKRGRYFGANDGKLTEYLDTWVVAESYAKEKTKSSKLARTMKSFIGKEAVVEVGEDTQVNGALLEREVKKDYYEERIFEEKSIKDDQDTIQKISKIGKNKEVKKNFNLESSKAIYFDGTIEEKDKNDKTIKTDLFKKEITEKEIKIEITNPEKLSENKDLFIQGLRHIELKNRGLKKDIVVVMPKVTKENKQKVEAVYNMSKGFLRELHIKREIREGEAKKRITHARIENKTGNVILNTRDKDNSVAKKKDIFKGRDIILIPDLVAGNAKLFTRWLKGVIVSRDITRGDLVLGLDKRSKINKGILNDISKELGKRFAEDITVVNKEGDILASTKDELSKLEGVKQLSRIKPITYPKVEDMLLKQKEIEMVDISTPSEIRLNGVRITNEIEEGLKNLKESGRSISSITVSAEFIESTAEILRLMTLMKEIGIKNCDIKVQTKTGLISLWTNDQIFTRGALVEDVADAKAFTELLNKIKYDDYKKYSIIFNLKNAKKISYKHLNKLIKAGKLGEVTITHNGKILATNEVGVKEFLNKYAQIKGVKPKFKSLVKPQSTISININKVTAGSVISGRKHTAIPQGSIVPVFAGGNTLACLSGATNVFITQAMQNYQQQLKAVKPGPKMMITDFTKAFGEIAKKYSNQKLDLILHRNRDMALEKDVLANVR